MVFEVLVPALNFKGGKKNDNNSVFRDVIEPLPEVMDYRHSWLLAVIRSTSDEAPPDLSLPTVVAVILGWVGHLRSIWTLLDPIIFCSKVDIRNKGDPNFILELRVKEVEIVVQTRVSEEVGDDSVTIPLIIFDISHPEVELLVHKLMLSLEELKTKMSNVLPRLSIDVVELGKEAVTDTKLKNSPD